MLRIHEQGERIPLTIADFDRENGTITTVFQTVGKTTNHLGALQEGDFLTDVVGPLGMHSHIEQFGKVICVGGGVGIAPIYPIARALREAGNTVISVIGARMKELIFWEDKMRSVSDELVVTTDDGSYGRKAVVTVPLDEHLTEHDDVRLVYIPSYLLCPSCQGLKMSPGSRLIQCPRCRGTGKTKSKRGKRSVAAVCRKCGGKGKIIRQPCVQCGGTGKIRQEHHLSFTIPPGVRTGTRLTVLNGGNPGSSGGPSGDLYIVINVNPHPCLERDGDDIISHLVIGFAQASLGDQVAVPTLDGMVTMEIPPGTQPGDILRIKDKGIPRGQGAGRGDQQVIIGLRIPSRLTSRQRSLLKQFAQAT